MFAAGLLIGGLGGLQASAQEPPLQERVERLIAQMESKELGRRQEAQDELRSLGWRALEYFPVDLSPYPAEVQGRLQRVRHELEQAKSVAAAAPCEVQLAAEMKLREVLDQLTQACGVPLTVPPGTEGMLTLMEGKTSFWPALDRVLDAAELDIDYYQGDPGQLVLVPRQRGRAARAEAATYASVFRLEVVSITARRDLRFARQNSLLLGVEIAWEPRLTPIGLTIPLNSLVARLDDGQELPTQPGQVEVATNPSVSVAQLTLPLALPEEARKLEMLRGRIRALLPGAEETFKIPLDTRHEGTTVGNVTVLVQEVRPNGKLHEVRLEVVLEGALNALESHRQWIFENPAYVVTADGKRLEHLGYQTYRRTADRLGIGYLFNLDEDLKGKTFHYQTPISVVDSDTEFVFRELQLP